MMTLPIVTRIDAFQRRHRVFAFMVAVMTKLSQDQSSSLAALFAYSSLFAIFPILLALISVLGLLLAHDPAVRNSVINSSLSNFPIIGTQLRSNIHSISPNILPLILASFTALMASRGVAGIAARSMSQIWYVTTSEMPNFINTLLRSFIWAGYVGILTNLGAALSSFSMLGPLVSIGGATLVNLCLFIGAQRLCLPRSIGFSKFYRGAIASGIAWQLLLYFGTQIVKNQLSHSTPLYGFFAIVLGLLTWVYLVAFITLVFSTADVVREYKLTPRSLDQSDPTEADIRAQHLIFNARANPAIDAIDNGSKRRQ